MTAATAIPSCCPRKYPAKALPAHRAHRARRAFIDALTPRKLAAERQWLARKSTNVARAEPARRVPHMAFAISGSSLPSLLRATNPRAIAIAGVAMSSSHPLSGLVVVEIGHSIAAPYAGMILGELGAEVIKVENPKGGDACRG